MYREHFGLVTNPFGIAPRLDFLYKSGAFAESMAHLVYGLENSEAIVMITGAIGTGKTMAVQSFLAHLGNRYLTALVTNTNVDAAGLLKLVLDDLDRTPPAGADKSDLLIAFKQLIIELGREGKRIVVVIDEAQNLDREVLEEIRLLTNLGQGAEQPVQIVLVGQPELERAVARPDLAQLRQRIRVHYKLAPLTREELTGYVDHRMSVAGGSEGVFTRGALDRIFEMSGGVPRLVNTLCGDALLAAFVAGRHRVEATDVDGEGVQAAAADASEAPAVVPPEPARETMAQRRPAPAPAPAPTEAPRAAPARNPEPRLDSPGKPRRGANWVWPVLAAIVLLAGGLYANYRVRGAWLWQAASSDATEPQTPLSRGDAGPQAGQVEPRTDLVDGPHATVADTAARDIARENPTASVDSTARRPEAPSASAAPSAVRPTASGEAAATSAARPVLGARVAAGDTQAAPTAMAAAGSAPAAVGAGTWYLHVSSFRTGEHAARAAAELSARGIEATTRSQTVEGTTWWRVYLGPFGDRESAVSRAEALRDQGDITYYKLQQLAVNAP